MRHRALPLLILASLFFSGCASKLSKVEDYERQHYHALSVFMSDAEKKVWLKLKTSEERDGLLKERGHWERYYQYDRERREAISDGHVKVGWSEDQVFMAWGQPYARKRLTGRPAARSELFIYRFEVDRDGNVMVWHPKSKSTYKAVEKYQLDVYVDDERVTEIQRKDRWE